VNWSEVGTTLLGQLGALAAFFAFPALQYVFLKRLARSEGQPELWHLPRYGFRLVIRNLPRRRTLSNIRYRSLIRTVVPAGHGASVATFQDDNLIEREDFFLFPGVDQVLVCFKLDLDPENRVEFLHTDKLGNLIKKFEVNEKTILVADFTANVENLFNFDIAIARRVEITGSRMKEIVTELKAAPTEEREFKVNRVREVG
jgi:hypothetical protein